MAILPDPADAPSRCPNAHVDGCPGCVTNSEAPEYLETQPRGCAAYYCCTDCGHTWTTSWGCR